MSSIRFDVITIFPEPFEAYFNESILRRARENKIIDIRIHDLRKFTNDKHHKTDDRPFGGGPGMVLKIEPLARALKKASLGGSAAKLVVLLDAGGKQFDAFMTQTISKKYKHIIFICGRYEGVDDRIKSIVKALGLKFTEISVGPYILTGGELPAMILIDAISRHIPGVLGKNESLEERRYGVGVPAYTRPEIFKYKNKKYSVPKVLLSGNHKNIEVWRMGHKK